MRRIHTPSRFVLPFLLMLGACMPGTSEMPTRAMIASAPQSALPPMKSFSAPRPARPVLSNHDIARDFLELSFQLESGRQLPALTRFEGPITLRVTGTPPSSLAPDLNRLLHRLRTEAGIEINQVAQGTANITIQAVPRSAIRAALPQAACFVVPNITDIGEYRAAKRSAKTNWAILSERRNLAVFLPNDAAPQEVRDCLHEEIAQALGPLNDLYRLPDSVFNDDNVHTVLTGFDMMILRAYYAPELHNGMSRSEVAARLPAILARINPAGQNIASRAISRTPREWIRAIQTALGPGANPMQRRAAGAEALRVAEAMGWKDHRRAFSHYAMGRLALADDPNGAQEQFVAAQRFYEQTPGTDLHRAYVASQLAAYALIHGRGEDALRLIAPYQNVAARHENAALLSTLMLLRAEALDLEGRVSEARTVRLDSLGWARYGFGADWAVRAKLREIGSLSPLKGKRGAL